MPSKSKRSQDVFLKAVEIPDDGVRKAYIDAECRDDDALRSDVLSLLQHAGRLGGFLEAKHAPVTDWLETEEIARTIGPTNKIGPYRLREQLGEGGMGVVYVAEQNEPVKRKVALKIIRPGMASSDVVARFEAERQALALMDHPHIARVYDAGATESGLPFFVMELVRGVPITNFCDERQLTTRKRLQLFIDVCQAIQQPTKRGSSIAISSRRTYLSRCTMTNQW